MKLFKLALLAALVAGPAGASAEDYSAPVTSINGMQGAVQVPLVQRQFVQGLVPVANGTVTWTFPTAFGMTPSCIPSIVATNTNYVFAAPVQNDVSATSVTITVSAALKILNITLGTLSIWGPPPSGTTVNLTCFTVQ